MAAERVGAACHADTGMPPRPGEAWRARHMTLAWEDDVVDVDVAAPSSKECVADPAIYLRGVESQGPLLAMDLRNLGLAGDHVVGAVGRVDKDGVAR